jgi:hypothetical protein
MYLFGLAIVPYLVLVPVFFILKNFEVSHNLYYYEIIPLPISYILCIRAYYEIFDKSTPAVRFIQIVLFYLIQFVMLLLGAFIALVVSSGFGMR